jgi:hypothetical protein
LIKKLFLFKELKNGDNLKYQNFIQVIKGFDTQKYKRIEIKKYIYVLFFIKRET